MGVQFLELGTLMHRVLLLDQVPEKVEADSIHDYSEGSPWVLCVHHRLASLISPVRASTSSPIQAVLAARAGVRVRGAAPADRGSQGGGGVDWSRRNSLRGGFLSQHASTGRTW